MSTKHDQSSGGSTENGPVEDVESDDDLEGDVEEGNPVRFNASELTNLAGSSQLRLGEMFKHSISPDFTSSIAKIVTQTAAALPPPTIDYRLLADSAGRSLRTSVLSSGLAEAVGRSAAKQAAFNITSGLKVSDSVSRAIAGLMNDTDGISLTAQVLGASNRGLTASSTLSEVVEGIDVAKLETSGLARAIGKNTALTLGHSTSTRALTEGLYGSGIRLSRAVAMQELVATSGIANLLGSDKMMASWRQSLLTEATARSLIGTIAVSDANSSVLRDIVGTNAATARVVGLFAEDNKALMLAPALSARPTRALRGLLAGLPIAPDADDLDFASRASRGIAGITAADLIVTDGTIDAEAVELLEAEVVEPWMSGADTSRRILFVRLRTLNPDVPDLLSGAWQQVETNGPAAASMASHAAQEVIDRTLRAVAPDDLVRQLDAAGRLPKNATYEKEGNLRPTRVGRIAAALHERRPQDAKVVAAQAKALAASVSYLSENFQAGKHASAGSVGLVRTYLVSVEAFLTQLLCEPGDG